jgi:hypothetical protein
MSLVPFISSEKVKKGMVKASVMVFTIAFFIPVIFLTLEISETIRGLTDLSQLYQ